jgi:hypothetical protein
VQENIFTIDEKGCLIGYLKKIRRVYSRLAFNSLRGKQVIQDRNRE